jgi:membrane dipeptidase
VCVGIGMHALDDNLDNIQVLYDAGVRMFGVAHFFDNEWAGSAHGVAKRGLTARGRLAIERLLQLEGALIDVAHSSPTTIDDLVELARDDRRATLVASHAGVRAVCDNVRNLRDSDVRGIAASGGVIGVG